MSDLDSARFLAAFPPIMSAIKIGSDGMRIQFDVPENQMAEAVKLLQWRERVLVIEVRPESKKEQKGNTISFGG